MKFNLVNLFFALSSTTSVFAQDSYDSKENKCAVTKNKFTDHINGPECLCENKLVIPILNNYFVENFKQCYNSSSLYFSSMANICSKDCFAPTVIGSQYIQDFCPQTKNIAPEYGTGSSTISRIPTKNLVYRSWANMDISKLACTKYEKEVYCLDRLFRVQTHYTSSKSGLDVSNHTEEICHVCNKRFVKELENPEHVPSIYVHQLLDPKGLFNFIKSKCF